MDADRGLPDAYGAREGAVDEAAKYLEALIDLRRVLPGRPLPTASALAEEIGVNRTAVLQAFQLLRREGLITVRRGRGGARVIGRAERSEARRLARVLAKRDGLEQMAVLREIVESGVARIAAERGLGADALARAKAIVREMRATRDRDAYLALDTQFHEILAEATGSEVLKRLALALRQLFLIGLDAVDVPDARWEESSREHERLLGAVSRGAAAAAADWAHTHAAASRDLVSEILAAVDRLRGITQAEERVG